MRRSTFLLAYATGGILTLFGSPWVALERVAREPGSAVGLAGAVALAAPLALILIALGRERATGQHGLHHWPAMALLVSSLPFLAGWFLRATGSPGLPDVLATTLVLGSVLVPLLLHFVCCVRGAEEPRTASQRAAA